MDLIVLCSWCSAPATRVEGSAALCGPSCPARPLPPPPVDLAAVAGLLGRSPAPCTSCGAVHFLPPRQTTGRRCLLTPGCDGWHRVR